jgi:hypothetical protein
MCPALLTVASNLKQLTHLDLGYVEVEPAGLAAVAKLQQLQCLTLYGSLSGLSAQVRITSSKDVLNTSLWSVAYQGSQQR